MSVAIGPSAGESDSALVRSIVRGDASDTRAGASAPGQPVSAQEAALSELRRGMLDGRFTPGSKIHQEAIAAHLGVSRVPVREALKILEGEGRVAYVTRRGYYVAQLDYAELVEIYRMRELLESEAVVMAMRGFSEAYASRMREAMTQMESQRATADMYKFSMANRAFHFALFEASGMRRMVRVIGQLWDTSDPYRSLYLSQDTATERANREHRGIFDAVTRRETFTVLSLLNEHRENAKDRLRAVLV